MHLPEPNLQITCFSLNNSLTFEMKQLTAVKSNQQLGELNVWPCVGVANFYLANINIATPR